MGTSGILSSMVGTPAEEAATFCLIDRAQGGTEHAMGVAEMAKFTGVSRPALHQALKRLVSRGWVRRHQGASGNGLYDLDEATGLFDVKELWFAWKRALLATLGAEQALAGGASEYAERIRKYASAIRLSSDLLTWVGMGAGGFEDHETALRRFGEALERNPCQWWAISGRVSALLALGRLGEVVAEATKALLRTDLPPERRCFLLLDRARAQMRLSGPEHAFADFAAAEQVQEAPLDLRAQGTLGRAWSLAQLGRREEAIQLWTILIADPILPMHIKVWALQERGDMYSQCGSLDAASYDFDQIISAGERASIDVSSLARAFLARGSVRRRKGERVAAISDLTQVVERPNVPGFLKALALAERALAHDVSDGPEIAKAISDCTEALAWGDLPPVNRAWILHSRGWAHFHAGDVTKATADWNDVLKIQECPNDLREQILGALSAIQRGTREIPRREETGASLVAPDDPGQTPGQSAREAQEEFGRSAAHGDRVDSKAAFVAKAREVIRGIIEEATLVRAVHDSDAAWFHKKRQEDMLPFFLRWLRRRIADHRLTSTKMGDHGLAERGSDAWLVISDPASGNQARVLVQMKVTSDVPRLAEKSTQQAAHALGSDGVDFYLVVMCFTLDKKSRPGASSVAPDLLPIFKERIEIVPPDQVALIFEAIDREAAEEKSAASSAGRFCAIVPPMSVEESAGSLPIKSLTPQQIKEAIAEGWGCDS